MNKSQYENTKIIEKVLINKIAKNEPEHILDSWVQPCGTHGCVAGDSAIEMLNVNLATPTMIEGFCQTLNDNFYNFFGFNSVTRIKSRRLDVFGSSGEGTLQERLDYVQTQLKQYEGENNE